MELTSTPREADFDDPELTRLAVEELGVPLEQWRRRHRKWWEWARVLAAGQRYANLTSDSRVLGIASGHETPLYWFCNHARIVVATDIYGHGVFSGGEADERMLLDPSCYAPIEYEHGALLVQRADARVLPFGNGTFDFAFSCSSVEHFGSDAEVVQAMREAFRVLRPGGIYALSVDYLWDEGSGIHTRRERRKGILAEFLTSDEVVDLLVEQPGFRLAEPLVFDVELSSPVVPLDGPDPNSVFPHLHLSLGDARFTSLFLILVKPRETAVSPVDKCVDILGR